MWTSCVDIVLFPWLTHNLALSYYYYHGNSFAALAACISHVTCFHGAVILSNWKRAVGGENDNIHTKMMRVYPEVPQLWYAALYVVMAVLSAFVCEVYLKQLPWWGLVIALAIGWALTLPICTMRAIYRLRLWPQYHHRTGLLLHPPW